jgi:hypothetical protein
MGWVQGFQFSCSRHVARAVKGWPVSTHVHHDAVWWLQGFRFSISWSRLVPGAVKGSPVNPKAVAFYGGLLDALQEAGIQPLVAL